MSKTKLIFKNIKNNRKFYYLYVFTLTFSVALYFTFVTLSYDPALERIKESVKVGAGIQSGSVLLIVIVAFFIVYANAIFMKRRSKEIGLLQLIGMTKRDVFRLLSIENIILYFGSLLLGSFLGFSVSKLMMMILFALIGIEGVASLHFSQEALLQTFVVFAAIYLLIMVRNAAFMKRQTILALFQTASTSEDRVKKVRVFEMILGIIGFSLIVFGYVLSAKLFSGMFTTMIDLSVAMMTILAAVIVGTYLVYRGFVSFVANLIRKKKAGFLAIHDVLSLSALMFRMKTNALLLTIITTVSALAIGLLSLSYIAYYSAEKSAKTSVPNHFVFYDPLDAKTFTDALTTHKIDYRSVEIDVIQAHVDVQQIVETSLEDLRVDLNAMQLPVISDRAFDFDVANHSAMLTNYHHALRTFFSFRSEGEIVLKGKEQRYPLTYAGMIDEPLLPLYLTSGGLPTVVIDDQLFQRLRSEKDEAIQRELTSFIGIDIEDEQLLKLANDIFLTISFEKTPHSQYEMIERQKASMGLAMFVVGFLGLTFLVTSGCILYLKQIDESELEKPNYTILRKLGFAEFDLLKGIQLKQLFNFAIPLIFGLSHSYFAVRSGWFFFGTEMWTPMLIVMGLYTALYSLFGFLSLLYDKKVMKEAL